MLRTCDGLLFPCRAVEWAVVGRGRSTADHREESASQSSENLRSHENRHEVLKDRKQMRNLFLSDYRNFLEKILLQVTFGYNFISYNFNEVS